MGTIRLGENDNDYRLGNILELDGWVSYEWANWLSTSFRLNTRIDMLFDVELYTPSGKWRGNRLGIEFGVPIYQNLEGPQLETDWIFSVGWQWIF